MFFKDYYWEEGIPKGKGNTEPAEGHETYKIVSDPYRKRISIEKYHGMILSEVIYDSIFLDFRQLRKGELMAWQTEKIEESLDQMICLIRNQDDRVVFRETHEFKQGYCRQCLVHSPQGTLLSIHKMSYVSFQDPFNGVVLYDANKHQVMMKKYDIDEQGSFTNLLEESWVI